MLTQIYVAIYGVHMPEWVKSVSPLRFSFCDQEMVRSVENFKLLTKFSSTGLLPNG